MERTTTGTEGELEGERKKEVGREREGRREKKGRFKSRETRNR